MLGPAAARRRVAYVSEGREVSYAELGARAEQVARGLYAAGARAGAPVATLLPGGAGFVEVMHAVLRIGAVLLPLHERLAPAELAMRLEHSQPTLLVHDDHHAATAATLPARAVRLAVLAGGGIEPPAAPRALDRPAAILYTSGSGAWPRAVPLTAGNLLWSALASAAVLGVRPDDRWLACLTPAHIGGLSILVRSAVYGTAAVIHDGFDAAEVARAIERDRVTVVSLVPPALERVLARYGDRPFPPALRCVLLGGGPIPPALLDECARRGVPVAPTYGLTEATSQVATRAPDDRRGGLRPLPGTELRIASDGEIVVRGPTVSAACADADGWLRTGDLGRLDADGGLHVEGRRDDLIVTGGLNVQPPEVEVVLEAHPAVAEAAVAGVPDGVMGHAVVAWVVPRSGASLTGELLRAHVRGRLAGFKVPRRVHLVTALPRTPIGKLARRELREP